MNRTPWFSIGAFVIIALLLLVFLPVGDLSASSNNARPAAALSGRSQVRMNTDYGTAEVVSGQFTVSAGTSKLEKAHAFIAGRPQEFKIRHPEKELELLSETTDNLGLMHLRFQQVFEGIPVWGCRTIVHFEDDQTIYLVGGQLIPTPEVGTSPTISEADASADALASVKADITATDLQTASELVIYPNEGSPKLARLVTITSPTNGAIRWRVFVDAQTGVVLEKFNDIHYDGPDVGSGINVQGVLQTFPIYVESGVYKLIDVTHPATVTTYENMYSGGPISTDPDGDKIWDDNVGQRAAVSAHVNAAQTLAYFQDTFGRNSFDDMGMGVIANVHDPAYVNNAYWNGSAINFADGDGVNYRPFSGSLDVVAHEFAHGVTDYTANLIYQFQSGALNESFSDVFGACVDRDDWLLGETIRITYPGFIRSMDDPNLTGQPKHMNDFRFLPISTDNGGVHINSGISNYAFYWAASLTSREIAEQIWYRTLTQYLTPSSGFYFWSAMTLQSAADLYGSGSSEYGYVLNALSQVGLNGTYASPEMLNMSNVVGTISTDTLWIVNPTTTMIDVLGVTPPSIPGLTATVTVTAVAPGDSSAILLEYNSTSMDQCQVGLYTDQLEVTTQTTGTPYASLIYVTVNVYVGFSTTVPTSFSASTACLSLTARNTAGLDALINNANDALYDGSLLVGVVDGTDTTTYRDVFGVQGLVPVDTFGGDPSTRFFRVASKDGRIQGTVTYRWYTGADPDTCGFFIAEYALINPCDTALKIFAGLFSDFDVNNSGSNQAGYDVAANLVYVTDNTYAAGFALLSDTAYNMRAISNPTLVWNGKFTDKVAYRELAAGANVAGASPNDYSALLSFGQTTLGPSDTALFKVALMYSAQGVAGLQQTAAVAKAYITPETILAGDANDDGQINVADAVYVINFVFKGGAPPVPYAAGDANCDTQVNVGDAVYLINFVFKGGPTPNCP